MNSNRDYYNENNTWNKIVLLSGIDPLTYQDDESITITRDSIIYIFPYQSSESIAIICDSIVYTLPNDRVKYKKLSENEYDSISKLVHRINLDSYYYCGSVYEDNDRELWDYLDSIAPASFLQCGC